MKKCRGQEKRKKKREQYLRNTEKEKIERERSQRWIEEGGDGAGWGSEEKCL